MSIEKQEISNQDGNNAFNNHGIQVKCNYIIYNSKFHNDFANQTFNFKIRKFPNWRILNKFNLNEYFVIINNVCILSLLSFFLTYFFYGINNLKPFLIVVLSCLLYSLVYYNLKIKVSIDIHGMLLNKEFIKFDDMREIKIKNLIFYKYLEIYFLNEIEPRFRIYPDSVYQLELIEDIFLNSTHQKKDKE